jgi:hypothetical protein
MVTVNGGLNWGGEKVPVRVAPMIVGLIVAAASLVVTIAVFYLILKIGSLVDALKEKVKEMKVG